MVKGGDSMGGVLREGAGSLEVARCGAGLCTKGRVDRGPRLLELLGQRSDVLHTVLVRCQIALEGLVAPQQCPHLLQ